MLRVGGKSDELQHGRAARKAALLDSHMQKIGRCRLCATESVKLCDSHIFPEFLYRDMYDDKQSFFVYSSNPQWRPSLRYSGIYEPLLCRNCEDSFGRLETYACDALFNGLKVAPELTPQAFVVTGVDYARFKLFFMSLLWRAGICTRFEFRNVDLHRHEKRLRRMLQLNDPGEPYSYPCALYVIKERPSALMSMPESFVPVHGYGGYRTTMFGMSWAFFLDSDMRGFPGMNCFLNTNGELPLNKDNDRGLDFLRSRIQGLPY